MPAAGWSTTEELGQAFELSNPSAADIEYLRVIAECLKNEFEQYMGRRVLASDAGEVTELVDGGVDRVPLGTTPIQTIVSVRMVLGGLRKFDPDYSIEVPATDYHVSSDRRFLFFRAPPPLGVQNVQVKYTGGYATVPGDIYRVWLMEVRKEWMRRKTPDVQTVAVAGSHISVSTPYGLTPETKRVLNRYRIWNVM